LLCNRTKFYGVGVPFLDRNLSHPKRWPLQKICSK